MAGEISPDIMFWRVWQKVMWVGADGYRSVRMGEDGCMGKEGSKNKVKGAPNGGAGRVFVLRDHGKKNQKLYYDHG